MKAISAEILTFIVLPLLSACAGVGIVSTSDPLIKLNDAEVLFTQKNRPVPAEKLIQEAIAIYQDQNNAHGLGNAYREYGDLLKSSAVARWEATYRRAGGFLDKSITFDNRQSRAAEFYRKALTYYEAAELEEKAAERYDALTNTYFNMAWAHRELGETSDACVALDHTIGAYEANMRRNPDAKPVFGRGFHTLREEVAAAKQGLGC
jgi:tetratricopeptide (TPR) repeat protein